MADKEKKNWELDLETYIRQGEPERSEKSIAWKTAIGLQDVDGLKTSDYLLETAKEHIEGRIDIKTVQICFRFYAGNYDDYLDFQNKNLEEGDELLRHKTRLLMAVAKKGKIKAFDGGLMIMVMDYIKVFETGKLVIRFYDGTEFECETE